MEVIWKNTRKAQRFHGRVFGVSRRCFNRVSPSASNLHRWLTPCAVKNDDAVGSSSSLSRSSMPSNDLENESFELRLEHSHSDVNSIASTVDLALSRAIQEESDVSATFLQQGPHRNKRNDHALRTSVAFKTALRNSEGHELESIFSAIERRSRTGTSGSEEVEFRPEVAATRNRFPTQPPAELRFNFQSCMFHPRHSRLRAY